MNTFFSRTRAIAFGLSLITTVSLASGGIYRRYGSDSLAQLPIASDTELETTLVGQSITFEPNTNAMASEDQYTIDILLEHGEQAIPVQLKNIDLSLMLPQVPQQLQATSALSQWFLTEREFNRQRVIFKPNSEHLVLPEKIGDYSAEQISVALTNNCLGAGYWEVALYIENGSPGGDRQKIYQGYFTFPRRAYGQLVAQLNNTSYWPLMPGLEGWVGFNFHRGRFFDMAALRTVETEVIIAGRDRAQEAVFAHGEQAQKAQLLVAAQPPETWQDLRNQTVQFQSFVPPGIYKSEAVWEMHLDELAHLSGAIARQVRSPLASQPLTEVELTFTSTVGNTRRLVVSGIDLVALPQLDPEDYSQGLYMPLGFGTPFTQDYAELKAQPPQMSPFFTVLLDGENRLLHYRKQVGINGIVLHRDAHNPHILHLYPMSYERITLAGHYTLDLTQVMHPEQAKLPPG
ncbi:MAG: hypothetical protein F6J87_01570 [Spirulina sp. SIO3F2]|nr:hypothetical protein [Spirulina sp. SIO3F2]